MDSVPNITGGGGGGGDFSRYEVRKKLSRSPSSRWISFIKKALFSHVYVVELGLSITRLRSRPVESVFLVDIEI